MKLKDNTGKQRGRDNCCALHNSQSNKRFQILIPNFRHPHFNFVGKILGPKGASLQAMAKQFKCHIYVLGRGSTKDRAKVCY